MNLIWSRFRWGSFRWLKHTAKCKWAEWVWDGLDQGKHHLNEKRLLVVRSGASYGLSGANCWPMESVGRHSICFVRTTCYAKSVSTNWDRESLLWYLTDNNSWYTHLCVSTQLPCKGKNILNRKVIYQRSKLRKMQMCTCPCQFVMKDSTRGYKNEHIYRPKCKMVEGLLKLQYFLFTRLTYVFSVYEFRIGD